MRHIATTCTLLLAFMFSSASAQEFAWTESRFHRVHLRNGNFIDGKLLQANDLNVLLQINSGNMIVKKDMIDRIEFIKVRSIWEKPKLDPPLVKVEISATPKVAGSLKAAPLQPLDAPPSLVKNVGTILDRMKLATREQKEDLTLRLGSLGEQSAPYLASLIDTLPSEDLKERVAAAVIQMKDPAALPVAVRLLDSGSTSVRLKGIRIIGTTGDGDYARHLTALVQDEQPDIRAAAIHAMQLLGDLDTFEGLGYAVWDADAGVRLAAITAVLELGRKHNRMARAVEMLAEGLQRASGRGITDLLSALSRAGAKESWRAAAPFLRDPEVQIRLAAARTLALLAHPESERDVVDQLSQEDDKRVKIELAVAIRNLRSFDAIETLITWLRGEDEDLKRAAVGALQGVSKLDYGFDAARWETWWSQSRPK